MDRILFFICILCALLMASPLMADTLTVTDMSGRSVTVPRDPKRIICLGPGTLRLIVYLRALDNVVGVESLEKQHPRGRPYWLANPGLHDLPVCGPGGPASINQKPDMEVIVRLDPELIFVTYMDGSLAEEVQSVLDIPVVVLSYGAFATFDPTVFDSLDLAGRILDRKQRAASVTQYILDAQSDLLARAKQSAAPERPEAYVGGIGYRGVQGLESTEQKYAPFDWVLVDNIARDMDARQRTHVFTNKETLLKLNPRTIFIDGGGLALAARAYKKNPEIYNALGAFARDRVYMLHPFNWYTTNIGTVLCDAYAVGKIMHQEPFADVDLSEKADEIYTFLVGAPVHEHMVKDYGPLGSKAPFIQENRR